MSTYNLSEDQLDLDYPNKRLKNFLEEHKIKYIDLKNNESFNSLTKELYYEIDGHFNPKGNGVVSEILFDFLVRERIV